MKNKKEKKLSNINPDDSLNDELSNIESISSNITSDLDEILKEVEDLQHKEILDEIKSEQDAIIDDLRPELEELKIQEELLDEIIKREDPLLEELKKHEDEIQELIFEYWDTASTEKGQLNEFHRLIDSNDSTFYKFAEAYRLKDEIDNENKDFAPDELKNLVFGGKTKLIRKKPIINIFDRLKWFTNPAPATFVLVSAALVFFMLLPIYNDNNGIEKFLYDERVLTDDKKLKDEIPVSETGMAPPAAGMAPPMASTFKSLNKKELELETYRGGNLSNINTVSLSINNNQLVIKQFDDLERTVEIFQENKLVTKKGLIDFEENLDNLEKILTIDLKKGSYKVIISFLKKEILNEDITIE